jgi:hypothetical protein
VRLWPSLPLAGRKSTALNVSVRSKKAIDHDFRRSVERIPNAEGGLAPLNKSRTGGLSLLHTSVQNDLGERYGVPERPVEHRPTSLDDVQAYGSRGRLSSAKWNVARVVE